MFRRLLFTFLLAAGLGVARAQVLYDPAAGTLPSAQGWSFLALPGPATPVLVAGTTRLDTTATNPVHAGFSRVAPLALERAGGFTLRFTLQVEAEVHANTNRAGVSVIMLAADKRGLELAFWTNRVWAQADLPLFTQAEGAAFDTTAAVEYDLRFAGDGYTLNAGGVTVLTGPLRDYTAFTGFPDVYETPNFLFLGDDTGSARGSLRLGRVELVTAVVPPPISIRSRPEGGVELSWPATAGVVLEVTSVLAENVTWTSPGLPEETVDGVTRVQVPAGEAQRWFRLR
jgi:hypothetical protein